MTPTDGPGATTSSWSEDELRLVRDAHELEIAVRRPDGTLRRSTPIWVVTVGEQVYVRSWFRRGTGWFGHAVADGRAQIRVPGLTADVTVIDVGADIGTGDDVRAGVDEAYRAAYGEQGAASMVTAEAAATTLRLVRVR